ncbi:MAG: PQQ-dependent sugar dehydrogenase, partial [Thermoanaerobaculia bacterium]|nr:PQQ-dependent sugar dehydrogenase [Thermoanaerobaculia bacterium]
TPRNPCGDPPAGPGGMMTPPDRRGRALRSQDLRTPADPTGWNGAILRLDPHNGEALPDNPLFGGQNAGDDPIIAYGLRNPFRFTIDATTGELWIGDVGWNMFEEIDHVADPTDALVENFGWPCFEGGAHQSQYDLLDLDLCETLYAAPAVTAPFFAYQHGSPPDPKRCDGPNNQASIAGLALYTGARYPARLQNALFFADHNRGCLWAIPRGAGGQLDPAQLETIVSAAGGIVDLTAGPDGDLFYVDLLGGTVHRITIDPTYVFGDAFESGDLSRWTATVP